LARQVAGTAGRKEVDSSPKKFTRIQKPACDELSRVGVSS